MNKIDLLKLLNCEDINDISSVINDCIFSADRDILYSELLKMNNNDLSYDWFQALYEDELAQRNQNKQDFTPNIVGNLLSRLTGTTSGTIYEPTAGNGSLLIANWWYRKINIQDFKASDHPVECWELSPRSIPILLLNLSIRGIIGTVYHGNVLTKYVKKEYILSHNDGNFSTITLK